MSKRRSFTKEQKLQILREGEMKGMLAICRKHEIAQSLYYRWKHAFEQNDFDDLNPVMFVPFSKNSSQVLPVNKSSQ